MAVWETTPLNDIFSCNKFCIFIFPGIEFSVVQKEVADILKNRTLVGHAIHNDMKVCNDLFEQAPDI